MMWQECDWERQEIEVMINWRNKKNVFWFVSTYYKTGKQHPSSGENKQIVE
jgi:hypothetical protein